jgi:hypothetical protein
MFTISIKTRIKGVWETLPAPIGLLQTMEIMYELVGTDSVVKMENSYMEAFLCGTQELVEVMSKVKKDKVCMTLESAHRQIDECPEGFFTVIQIMSAKKDVEKLFDSPLTNKKGWEHLKGETK